MNTSLFHESQHAATSCTVCGHTYAVRRAAWVTFLTSGAGMTFMTALILLLAFLLLGWVVVAVGVWMGVDVPMKVYELLQLTSQVSGPNFEQVSA